MNYQFLKDNNLSLADVWAWGKKLVQDLNSRDGQVSTGIVPIGGSVGWDDTLPLPNGFIRQDGTSYDITTYPALFSVIGYTYGGAGSNFNVNTVSDTVVKY